MALSFDVVDVFTDHPFAGNQLAVVHGASSLPAEDCLAITREFNFSESVFPGTPDPATGEYTARIFTPGGEIPFAGHPTLGTAWVLRQRGSLTADEVVQVCAAGEIGVRIDDARVEEEMARLVGDLLQVPAAVSAARALFTAAAALSLRASAVSYAALDTKL